MSAFDLSRIVDALISSKIKSRSDALNLLETYSASKLKVNPRQFSALASALVKLIQNERDIYSNNATNPVIHRLSTASNFLCELVEEALRKPSRSQPRYKHFISIVSAITSSYFVDGRDLILDPCSVQFARLIKSCLSRDFFKYHLTIDAWIKLYHFHLRAIENVLSHDHEAHMLNEALLHELYSSLYLLIGGEKASVFAPLLEQKRYFPILRLLKTTLKLLNKRESATIVMSFKIINKLLIIMSTEDFIFSHELIKIAVQCFILFATSSLESVQTQIAIFINLLTVYRYMDICALPKLIGQNDDLEGDSEEDSFTNRNVQLYNLGTLIQSLISRVQLPTSRLELSDIGFSSSSDISEFSFRDIYLKSNKGTSWLILRGLSKLIDKYYEMRSFISSELIRRSFEEQSMHGSVPGASSFKRQKVQEQKTYLWTCTSASQFFNALISTPNDHKIQIIGLQLLVFHAELLPNPEKEPTSILDDDSEISKIMNFNDSTVLDINLGYGDEKLDSIVTLTNVIKAVQEKSLTFWALLACQSLLGRVDIKITSGKPTLAKRLHQLLKMILPYINDIETGPLACNILFQIVLNQGENDLPKLLDKILINQLENILDLSELGGPIRVDESAIRFWWAAARVFSVSTHSSELNITNSIGRWFISRWSERYINSSGGLKKFNALPFSSRGVVSDLLLWIGGDQVNQMSLKSEAILDPELKNLEAIFKSSNSTLELERFIALDMHKPSTTLEEIFDISFPSLAPNTFVLDTIVERISDTSTLICNSGEDDLEVLVSWASSLLIVGDSLSKIFPQASSQLQNGARNIWSLVSRAARLPYDASIALAYVLKSGVSKRLLEDTSFPFEALEYHFRLSPYLNERDNNASFEADSDFDSEFSPQYDDNPNSRLPSPHEKTAVEASKHAIQYFEFLFTLHKGSDEGSLRYLEKLTPKEALTCLSFVVENASPENFSNISPLFWMRLVRLMGEGPLSDHETDRSDEAVGIACKLIEMLIPISKRCDSENLLKDCLDLLGYFIQCCQKSLLITENSQTRVWNLIYHLIADSNSDLISRKDLERLFLTSVKVFSNRMLINIARSIENYLAYLDPPEQMIFYKELIIQLKNYQESPEAFASYCLFFCLVSKERSQLRISALFNLIECTKFDFFDPYLKQSVELMSDLSRHENTKSLFTSLKIELLKCWWNHKHHILKFPHYLFGYTDNQSFITENYKEIIAVLLSIKHYFSIDEGALVIDKISKIKASDSQSMICDSLPFIIPLAYTSEGIRNSIFKALALLLKDTYKTLMIEKTLLIVLQTIKLTDSKSEDAFKFALGAQSDSLFESSEILDISTQAVVSPMSSYDLIRALIKKYWLPGKSAFWSLQSVYFVIRQIGRDIEPSSIESILSSLRRIKYVLQMSAVKVNQLELVKLLIDTFSPFIATTEVDLTSIWNIIDMEFLKVSPTDKTVPVIFEILDQVLLNRNSIQNTRCYSCLIDYIRVFGQKFGTALPIFEGAINLSLGKSSHLAMKSVGEFLVDPHYQSVISKKTLKVYPVLSKLFPHVKTPEFTDTNPELAAFFIHLNLNGRVSDDFQLWISRYLAHFYLSGTIQEDYERIMHQNESVSFTREDFSNNCKTMDSFIDLLLLRLEGDDPHNVAFIENILGTLLWKYENRPREVQKFFSFDKYCTSLMEYLVPLDFHSCVLLNSELDMQIQSSNLHTFLSNFRKISTEHSFDDWASQLMLALLQEVSAYTSISSLLASTIVKIPSLSKEVLPSFICFFISITGKTGAAEINDFLKVYWENFRAPYNPESISLIKNILLFLRVGAKQKIEVFSELYSNLNLESIFQIIKESNLPKMSLMIFEDSVGGKIETVDWKMRRKSIAAIYNSLDEKDMLSGLPEDASLNYSIGIIDELESSLDKMRYSNGFLDASMTLKGNVLSSSMIKSMMDDGLMGTSALVNRSIGDNKTRFEWAWKLSQWDVIAPTPPLNKNEAIFSYFKQIREDASQTQEIFESLMLGIIKRKGDIFSRDLCFKDKRNLARQWLESMACIYASDRILSSPISQFSEEIDSFDSLTDWFETTDSNLSEDVLHARQLAFEFYGKYILSLHGNSSLSITSSVNPNHDLCWQAATGEIYRRASLYQENAHLQKMVSATILMNEFAQHLEFSDSNTQGQLLRLSKFQAANSFWLQGETGKSVVMLEELQSSGPICAPFKKLCIDTVSIKSTLVKWLAESRQELGTNLLERFVDPMKDDIELVDDVLQRGRIYHSLAFFCDQQYKSQNLSDQIKEYSKRVEGKKNEIEEIKNHYGQTSVTALEKKAVQKYYYRLKGQVAADSSKLETLGETKRMFALNAVEFFLKSLLLKDVSNGEDLDKFFSLFLSLSNEEVLQKSISDDLRLLPSHQPLVWCTQLLSRISNEMTIFQESVQNLVMKVFQEHPFHSLYYLISLIHHEDYSKNASNAAMLPKVEAAKKLRANLISLDLCYAQATLLPIERLFDQCISLAELKTSKGRSIHLDKLKIGEYWLNELPSIPPPTLQLPVSKTGYADIPRMINMDPKVSVATSGISLPKIANFSISDGSQHKMLLKFGTDDLRQDATMEQVFEKVNNFFKKDKETRRRKLRVRTYKAVPLGPKAGVIEFVPNSKAFIEVIRPYHQKCDAIKAEKAREMMKECQTELTSRRLTVYKGITQKIHPVLRQYFVDTFITPDIWFEARQIYTKGIAASSMVGHILGLGDRHCNNILLDQYTGEPIHIDLGVAFDQGKRLPIPETVPFRLTRDIVDGFGLTGTKGAFSKLSEHTLRVLRENRDHIIAILDVLRWDPLYSWSISPIRMTKLQEDNTGIEKLDPQEDGSEASAAVATVKEKMHHEGLSAEATVRDLIREATSEENLAVIYCGWCPFY